MFSQMLVGKGPDEVNDNVREVLNRMNNAAARMQNLITSLLKYSRASSSDLSLERTDLQQVVSDVLEDLETRISEAGGRVEVVGTLPAIDADGTQMRQLFQNLIANGLRFHRDEPPVVQVHAENGNGRTVKIQVRDNGIGFEQQYADSIFKPFQRLVNRRKYEGSGIGLAVCRKIVDRHGGAISVQSVPDQGSTFIVELPVSRGKAH